MIMIGSPVLQDRAWVIEKYLCALIELDYPKESIHLAFLVNGEKQDNTLAIIQQYQDIFDDEYGCITVRTVKGNETDGRVKRNFQHFANIRNQWIDLRRDEDEYVFSVDSDIIVRPETLNKLKSYDLDIVSALIDNTWNNVEHYNILDENDIHISKPRIEKSLHYWCLLFDKK